MKKTLFFLSLFFIWSAHASPAQKTIDLTKLGANMQYAQVYNMLMEAENFKGARVKMRGIYYENTDMSQGPEFHCILVNDNMGCCSAGFDILKAEDSISYPKNLTNVEATGIFVVREEDGILRSYLIVDSLKVL